MKPTGKDAATIKPKFVPDEELLARDDSGGPNFDPYTAEFGDGGFVEGGDKAHLSASGGREPRTANDEQTGRDRAGDRGEAKGKVEDNEDGPKRKHGASD